MVFHIGCLDIIEHTFYILNMANETIDKTVDVICQHKKDGTMIPLKIRLTDEDGETQDYRIKSYRPVTRIGTFELSNMAAGTVFEIRIVCFDKERVLTIMYHDHDRTWRIHER